MGFLTFETYWTVISVISLVVSNFLFQENHNVLHISLGFLGLFEVSMRFLKNLREFI